MEIKDLRDILSLIADIVGIVGVTLIAVFSSFYSIFKKNRDDIAIQISIWLNYLLKTSIIILLGALIGLFFYDVIIISAFADGTPILFSLAIVLFLFALYLTITWLFGSVIWTMSFRYVFQFLSVLGFSTKVSPKLEILSAAYGAQDRFIDLTPRLIQEIRDNKLTILVGNDLGGDPYIGIGKKMIVKYRFGLVVKEIEINEGEILKLPVQS